jgi:hypothetical protein
VGHVEAVVLDFVEPADVHLVQMPVRLEPRDRLVVCPQVKVGPAALLAGRSAAQQVVPEYSKGVNHRQQLQDMCWIVPLRRSQLAVHRNAFLRETVPKEAELLPPELAFGAFSEQLPAVEDLEYLRDVE